MTTMTTSFSPFLMELWLLLLCLLKLIKPSKPINPSKPIKPCKLEPCKTKLANLRKPLLTQYISLSLLTIADIFNICPAHHHTTMVSNLIQEP